MKHLYCPQCGAHLTAREIGDEGLVPYCERCARPWFDSFSTCIIALAVNEYGEAALLRQSDLSDRYHTLVSGYIKPGETAEETAAREILEETGLRVDLLESCGTFWLAKREQLMLGYFAAVKKQEFVLSGEIDSARWVSLREALPLMYPGGSISSQIVAKYLALHPEWL